MAAAAERSVTLVAWNVTNSYASSSLFENCPRERQSPIKIASSY
jgi:hypothetical protein